jgi:hypothetical protein
VLRGGEANGKGEMGLGRRCGEQEREDVSGKGERALERGDKNGLLLGGV